MMDTQKAIRIGRQIYWYTPLETDKDIGCVRYGECEELATHGLVYREYKPGDLVCRLHRDRYKIWLGLRIKETIKL